LLLLLLLALAAAACGKASEEDCRKAVINMQKIRGLENDENAPNVEAQVRQCQTSASQKTVDCIIAAKTPDDLDACEGKKK
jgi:hypothetical protein